MFQVRIIAIARFVAASIAGMVALFVVAEAIEFGAVQAAAGEWTTDQERYFAIRNRPVMLAMKFQYQSLATVLAGYVTATIAGSPRERSAGIITGIVQAAMFVVALNTPELRRNAPDWVWLALIPLTLAGFVAGAAWRARSVSAIARRESPVRP